MNINLRVLAALAYAGTIQPLNLVARPYLRFELKSDSNALWSQSFLENTRIEATIQCPKTHKETHIKLSYIIRRGLCINQFEQIRSIKGLSLINNPTYCSIQKECNTQFQYLLVTNMPITCKNSEQIKLTPSLGGVVTDRRFSKLATNLTSGAAYVNQSVLLESWATGFYMMSFEMGTDSAFAVESPIVLNIITKGDHGLLSASDFPFIKLYASTCALYALLGLIWFVLCVGYWQELMRIQTFVGQVILIAFVESAFLVAAYDQANKLRIDQFAIDRFERMFAYVDVLLSVGIILSCFRRAMARAILILLSYGFGIVKPKMGPIYRKVTVVTVLYFVSSLVEAFYSVSSVVQSNSGRNRDLVLVVIPVALIDASITIWIFSCLLNTVRGLKLKKNQVKLKLYRRFTNTLMIAMVIGYICWTWSMTRLRFTECRTYYAANLIDTCFWTFLFMLVLVSVAILWTPSANNKRYAYAPLLDPKFEEDPDEDGVAMTEQDQDENVRRRPQQADEVKLESLIVAVHNPEHITPTTAEVILDTFDFEDKADRLIDEMNKMS